MRCLLQRADLPADKQPIIIELQNNEKLILGRNKTTKVKDAQVSRNQLEVTANFTQKTVNLKQIGPNVSFLNGEAIGIGIELTAKQGDTFELLQGEFKFNIIFEVPEDQRQDSGKNTNKRNLEDESDLPPPKRIPNMFLPKEQQSSANEFRKDQQTSVPGSKWENVRGNDLLIYSSQESAKSSTQYVGAFDMDGTLITTKSGRVFPRDDNDWRFLSSAVVPKVQAYFKDKTFKFVIFTNQAGLEKRPGDIPSFKKKIECITRAIAVPVLVFIGTGKNEYRKPMTGSWDVFVQKYNEGIEPDRTKSFYCGDAAGRKKDHSLSDRLFALNLHIPFLTPEEFFNGQTAQEFTMPTFNPRQLVEGTAITNNHIDFPHPHEMILLVGYPASGKSSFVKSVLLPKSYVHVNRDTIKSMAKCVTAASKALTDSSSVVIDNTNGTKKAREEFIKVGKKHNVIIRCFKMNADFTHAQHNDKFRQLGKEPHDKVPMVAFNTFRAQFQEPSLDEGFDEIVSVNFVPQFATDEQKKLYSMFLLEK